MAFMKKIISNTNTTDKPNRWGQQFCPECGNFMREADRLEQNKVLYVWYRCSCPGCEGSQLKQCT
jgi:hypothetical protein